MGVWPGVPSGDTRGDRAGSRSFTSLVAAAAGERAVLRESLAGGDSGKGTPDSAIACTLSAPAAASNCSASGTEDCLLSGKVHMLPSGCVWPRREDTRIPCDFVLVDIINRYTHSLLTSASQFVLHRSRQHAELLQYSASVSVMPAGTLHICPGARLDRAYGCEQAGCTCHQHVSQKR